MLQLLAEEGAGSAASILQSPLVFIVPLLLVWWFLVFRPQRKQEKERKTQLEALKKGDKVITRGGIVGTVSRVKDDQAIVRIDIDGKVQVAFNKAAIEQVLTARKTGDGK